jgi:hypothetical protein
MNETTTTLTQRTLAEQQRAEQWRAAEPTLAEQWRAGQPPSTAVPVIAVYFIATFAIVAGALTVITWAKDQASGSEGSVGFAAFFTGWLFLGFAYALRKLQLIEWRLQNRATQS